MRVLYVKRGLRTLLVAYRLRVTGLVSRLYERVRKDFGVVCLEGRSVDKGSIRVKGIGSSF